MFGVARYTVRSFSIRRNEKISCFVTIRGEKAMQLLVRGGAGGARRPERAASGLLPTHAPVAQHHASPCALAPQEAGLKVKEYELLRKNFSDTGNFGASWRLAVGGSGRQQQHAGGCDARGHAPHPRAHAACSRREWRRGGAGRAARRRGWAADALAHHLSRTRRLRH